MEYDFDRNMIYIKNRFIYEIKKIGNPITINNVILAACKLYRHEKFWSDFNVRYKKQTTEIKRKIVIIEKSKKNKKKK